MTKPIHLTPGVMVARCSHCNRLLGYRTCAPENRGNVTHGHCLPFCPEMLANGWGEYPHIEAALLAKRPWLQLKEAA